MNEEYFKWLIKKIGNSIIQRRYSKLLRYLYKKPFTYSIDLDENRMLDGLELRYEYADTTKQNLDDIFFKRTCSVLEMMIALAVQAEVHIMDNPTFGDRTHIWFWEMISSLGLNDQTNSVYNPTYVDDVINRLLDRKYAASGKGGLFTIPNCKHDLRTVDIWYQMNWYMTWYLKQKGEL